MRQIANPLSVVVTACGITVAALTIDASEVNEDALVATPSVPPSSQPVHLGETRTYRDLYGYDVLDQQYKFLQQMPSVSVEYAENGSVRRLTGSLNVFIESGLGAFQLDQSAPAVIEKLGPALLAAGTEELRVRRIHSANSQSFMPELQQTEGTVRFRQYIRGHEVLLGWVNISIDEATGEITSLAANFLPDRGLPQEPKLNSGKARQMLESRLREDAADDVVIKFSDVPPKLAYTFESLEDGEGKGGALVWVFELSRSNLATLEHILASVNAINGEVIRLENTAPGAIDRITYTANYGSPPPSGFPSGLTFKFNEGGFPADIIEAPVVPG